MQIVCAKRRAMLQAKALLHHGGRQGLGAQKRQDLVDWVGNWVGDFPGEFPGPASPDDLLPGSVRVKANLAAASKVTGACRGSSMCVSMAFPESRRPQQAHDRRIT